jgi:hypothetical protein
MRKLIFLWDPYKQITAGPGLTSQTLIIFQSSGRKVTDFRFACFTEIFHTLQHVK